MTFGRFDVWTFGIALVVSTVMCGCQTERVVTSDGRPLPQEPVAPPATPPDAQVNRMAFMVGSKPEDTTGNGYPDLIRATVALFATPHPMAVRAEGVFEFALYERGMVGRPGARPLAIWRKEGEAVRRSHAIASYGPCYQFMLSLVEQGSDVIPLTSTDLRCTFYPADGSPAVHSDGVRSIQIGALRGNG